MASPHKRASWMYHDTVPPQVMRTIDDARAFVNRSGWGHWVWESIHGPDDVRREACASLARALWARIPAGTNLVEYGRTDEGWHTIERIVNGIVLSHQPVCSR